MLSEFLGTENVNLNVTEHTAILRMQTLKKKKDAVSRGKLDSFLKEYIPNYMLEKEPSEREKKGRRGGTCRGGAI